MPGFATPITDAGESVRHLPTRGWSAGGTAKVAAILPTWNLKLR